MRIMDLENPTFEFTVEAYALERDGKYYPAVRVMRDGKFHSDTSYGEGFEKESDCIPIANMATRREVESINAAIKSVTTRLSG